MDAQASPLVSIPDLGCICQDDDISIDYCLCGKEEKKLRVVAAGRAALDDKQREWCLAEVHRVEGWDEYEYETDPMLADAVLEAWVDFCRDKGL